MVAVIIPCYRVKKFIKDLVGRIGPEVEAIYIIDDKCPEQTGKYVCEEVDDPRVQVIFHTENMGVGGAVITGYQSAMKDGHEIMVKMDGDGQMDPRLVKDLVRPIQEGQADYVKGNRFFFLENLRGMPKIRLFGNTVLSFINKMVSGYWNIMDPTNGLTAIHARTLLLLPLEKVAKRYFFESDMLFRLNIVRAVVMELPMKAHYGDEESSMKISQVALSFPFKFINRFSKRIFYNYFLRNFNLGSLCLLLGAVFIFFGMSFGLWHWIEASSLNLNTATGTVMLAVLPIILGFQMIIFFFQQDISSVPSRALQSKKILQSEG